MFAFWDEVLREAVAAPAKMAPVHIQSKLGWLAAWNDLRRRCRAGTPLLYDDYPEAKYFLIDPTPRDHVPERIV
jgi:hypothetical protein